MIKRQPCASANERRTTRRNGTRRSPPAAERGTGRTRNGATSVLTAGRQVAAWRVTVVSVFTGSDFPVKIGLVSSLNRPSGNMTGASLFAIPPALLQRADQVIR